MRKKILVAIILNVLIISATLGVFSYLTVQNSIRRSLDNRLMLANIIAGYIEVSLQTNINRLLDISLSGKIDLGSGDWEPERKALETAYRYSLFTDSVFLLDRQGNVLITYPPHDIYAENLSYIDSVNQVLRGGKPVISNIYTLEPIKKQVVFMMVPLRDRRDTVVGVAGGVLSPTNLFINTLLQRIKTESGFIEIIDLNEIILASDHTESILQHRDYGGDLSTMIRLGQSGIREYNQVLPGAKDGGTAKCVLAFVPLRTAPWGIIVGQTEKIVFEPARSLERNFFMLVIVFIGLSVVFGIGISMRIVRPLRTFAGEADRIAGGDLSKPVADVGSDEVLQLSKSFEKMRVQLAASLDSIQRQNLELEQRVAMRTSQIRESRQKVRSLLKKVISSQEEERKRVARHLHDEILQDISAILINLDICKVRPEDFSVQRCDEIRAIAMKTIDSVRNVIQDLRPTVLDDLGLHAAIKWLVEKHLMAKGISCSLEIYPADKRFPRQIERVLFLIIQEAIINIARHADAAKVFVTLIADYREVYVTIEDDGKGFNVSEALRAASVSTRGLGILGMRERAVLADGKFEISSISGKGTSICVIVPYGPAETE
jgi:signal transduction histidine kinase